jgi:hypothetical protein
MSPNKVLFGINYVKQLYQFDLKKILNKKNKLCGFYLVLHVLQLVVG